MSELDACAVTPHWLALYAIFGVASMRVAALLTTLYKLRRKPNGQA